ncbi:MAG: outer membrane beta-barrel protein [Bacteroidota bacterium]
MRKLLLFSLLLPFMAYSQLDSVHDYKMVNEHLLLNIFENYWLNASPDMEIKPGSVSTGLTWYLVVLGKKSNVSFNLGYGFTSQSIKSNIILTTDSLKNTVFNSTILDTTDYRINKFSASYLDIPVEIRFRTNPNKRQRNFSLALGFRVGLLVQSYSKYYGDEFRFPLSNEEVKFKEYKTRNILPYHYGIQARIGYGKFYLFGSYYLTGVFKKGKGPEVIPVNFGFGFTLYRSKAF